GGPDCHFLGVLDGWRGRSSAGMGPDPRRDRVRDGGRDDRKRPAVSLESGPAPSARGLGMLGFAIVGCGMIARFHARALAEVPNTRPVALWSRAAGRAKAL